MHKLNKNILLCMVSLLLLLVFLGNTCNTTVEEVEQPPTVNTGAIFTITVAASDSSGAESTPHKGVLGILVPDDWSFVSGQYEFTTATLDGSGSMYEVEADHEDYMADHPDSVLEAPDGMKWMLLLSEEGTAYTDEEIWVEYNVELMSGQTEGEFDLAYYVTKNSTDLIAYDGYDLSEGHTILVSDARIIIVEPPGGDASLLQPFPLTFNMDTGVVNWQDPTFFPFSGAELARIENPDPSGLNETDYVLEYTKPQGSDAWAGFFYHLENPVHLTDESVFRLKVWSPRADIEAVMKLELQAGGGTPDQIADVTVADEWIELVWDLSALDHEIAWDKVTVIMDIDVHPVPETETWYLDDFSLEGVELVPGPLAGAYYIPQGAHAKGFASLGEALAELNQHGANNPVTFYIDDDLDETENTLLISRQDLTEDTSLLIKPAPGKTPTITVARSEGGDRTGSTGFSIERAHWVTIDGSNEVGGDSRDLTILFDEGEVTIPGTVSIMTIYSTVNHITVKNTNLTHGYGEMGRGILLDRSAGQDSLVQNITLHNVSVGEEDQVLTTAVFLNGVFGTGVSPAEADLMDNITITDSDIYGTRWCIYVQSASNLDFHGNHCVINGYSAVSDQSQRAGIQLQLAKDANVSGNTIVFGDINYQTNASGIGGIFLNRNHGPLLISNNMINFSGLENSGSGTGYVITGIGSHVGGTTELDPEYYIYHNTILINSPAEEVGKHVGIGPIAGTLSGRFDIRNNIVVNLKDADNSYAIENILSPTANVNASFESNFNNLFVTGDASVGFWDGEAREDLAAWRAASGLDAHSVSVDVEFVSDTDLRLAGESIGNFALAGFPLEAVTTDIDGNPRHPVYPYMGAFESDVVLIPDRITIVEPPGGDASLLHPFPLAFNMDTEDVEWRTPTFFPFSGAELARILNPDKSGLNETDFVLEYTKPQGSDAWAGFFYHLENPIHLTNESVFRLKVWSPRADIEAVMKLELQAGGGTPDQIADVTEADEWIELVWDLSALDHEIAWDKVTVIMDIDVHPVPETETWYLDDFSLEGVVELDPDRIVIVEPPDGDASLLQLFPLEFNMDTDIVDWNAYTFFPFAGAELARIGNPDKSGLNESNFVLEYTKPQGSDAWAGFFYQLENPINLTDQSVFKLKVWSPRADIEAILKLEVMGGPATGDLKADVTAAGEWIELVWDISDQNQETDWDRVVVIMDLDVHPVPQTETWYLDDFRLEGVTPVSVDQLAHAGIPDRFELSQNYPNPFNPSTTIRFSVPKATNVRLEIYNLLGQRVKVLISDELYQPGIYNLVWNGVDEYNKTVASGQYIYRIIAGDFVESKQMIFLK
jgi:hypothetical protein